MADDPDDSLRDCAQAIAHDPSLLLDVSPQAQRALLQLCHDGYDDAARCLEIFVVDILALANEGRVSRLCDEQNRVLWTFLGTRGSQLWIRTARVHIALCKGRHSGSWFVVTEVVFVV